jgi:hypothetical protein
MNRGNVFLVEYMFWEDNRYTDLVQEKFAEKLPGTPVPHRNAVRTLIDKFRETGSVLGAEQTPFVSAQCLSECTVQCKMLSLCLIMYHNMKTWKTGGTATCIVNLSTNW